MEAIPPGIFIRWAVRTNVRLPLGRAEEQLRNDLMTWRLGVDSGGTYTDTHRGGMGLRRVYRAEAEMRVEVDSSRSVVAPNGLAGGEPGGTFYYTVNGRHSALPHGIGMLQAGDVLEISSPGAGGFGLPGGRSEEARARDIREGRL